MEEILPEERLPAARFPMRPPPGRLQQAVELGVFVGIILPPMVLAMFVAASQQQTGFVVVALANISEDLALVALILYFLWRNGEPFGRIGWRVRPFWRELLIGLVLYAPVFFLIAGLEQLFRRFGLTSPQHAWPALVSAQGGAEMALAVLMVGIVAVAEETIFRGYLLLRFRSLVGGSLFAAVASSAIFALGHAYEGSAGMATVGSLGLLLSLIYLWRGSLVAPITIHFCQDLLGIVIVPLLQ